jgi:hypothetical protein
MIDLPSDLVTTVRILVVMSDQDQASCAWPAIDEDQIGVHARSWSDAATTLTSTVQDPMTVRGTIWLPTTPWAAGNDKPLDAFINFWMQYPYAHYSLAAKQATATSGALNNIAGIIKSYKISFIKIVQATKNELSRTYHALGASHTVGFFHTGGEANLPYGAMSLENGDNFSTIAPNESAGRASEDQAAINSCVSQLVKLATTVRQDIALQVRTIDLANGAMDSIKKNAAQAGAALPDQTYANPNPAQNPSQTLLTEDMDQEG